MKKRLNVIYVIAALIFFAACNSTKSTKEDTASKSEMEMTKERLQKRDKQFRDMGTDFLAIGNHPAWVLRIDYVKKVMNVEIATGGNYHFDLGDLDYIDFHNLTASQANNTIILTAEELPCWDLVSGERFPYRVSMELNNEMYHGCAKDLRKSDSIYLISPRLNDIWALVAIGHKVPDWQNTPGQRPVMEIHLNDMTVHGTTGCNDYQGKVLIDGDKMSFGPLGMTRKFCEGSMENEFVKALDKVNSYELLGLELVLKDKEGNEILRFKKVD